MNHRTTPDFWDHYRQLPENIQERADRNFEFLNADSRHPSLHFKKVTDDLWSARVGLDYRALGADEGDTVMWFWIGPHDEYEQFLR